MRIGSVLGSYLKADDLGGRRLLVTMDRVAVEKIGDEEKPVLYFVGKNKGLVLNRTNADSIIEITGSEETDDWQGVPIVIHPDKTMFAGKKVDCIRIAPHNGAVAAAPPPPPRVHNPDDDIPF